MAALKPKPIRIFTLPPVAGSSNSTSAEVPSIRDEIEAGLQGTDEPVVPGKRSEDRRWSFKRSVPTVVLYDEQGLRWVLYSTRSNHLSLDPLHSFNTSASQLLTLRLYDRITSDAPEYYLFPDELNLLKQHGHEIALSMGFPGAQQQQQQEEEEKLQQEREEQKEKNQKEGLYDDLPNVPAKRWRQGKWGDTEVGKWNNGVNGEEGLGGGCDRGYDVVELGAG